LMTLPMGSPPRGRIWSGEPLVGELLGTERAASEQPPLREKEARTS
jgi:hypothetical protein